MKRISALIVSLFFISWVSQAQPTFSSLVVNGTNTQAVVTFSAAVGGNVTVDQDLDPSDFTVTISASTNGGTVSAGSVAVTVTHTAPSATATLAFTIPNAATADGSEILTVKASGAASIYSAGGPMTGLESITANLNDLLAPVISSINLLNPATSPTNAATLIFRVTYSESVTGVAAGNFNAVLTNVTAGTITTVTGSGTTWDVTVPTVAITTPGTNGTLRLDADATPAVTDAAGNAFTGTKTGDQTYTVDQSAPTILSINRFNPGTNPTNSATLIFRVNYSESVTGVDVGNFSAVLTDVTAGAITSVTGSGTTWDVTVPTVAITTPGTNGTVRLDADATPVVSDAAGNAFTGTKTGDQTYTVDQTVPTILSINLLNPATSPTNAATLIFRVTYSESVTGVAAGNFNAILTDATAGAITTVTGSGTTWDVTVPTVAITTPGTNGTVRLDADATPTVSDIGGNTFTGTKTGDQTYTVDQTVPTILSINLLNPATSPTNAATLIFRVTYSESVTGVAAGNFNAVLTNVTAGTITSVTGSGTTWDVTVPTVAITTPGTNGTVRLDADATPTVSDAGGNTFTGTKTGDQTYTVDQSAPTILSINLLNPATSPTNSATLIFRVTYSESVTGVAAGNFTAVLTNVTAGAITTVTGSGTTWDVTVPSVAITTPGTNGTVRLDADATPTVSDAVGNAFTGTKTGDQTYTVDQTIPTILSINLLNPATSPTNASTLIFRVIYSESVTGVAAGNFNAVLTNVTAGTITSVTGSGTTWDVTVPTVAITTPGTNGTVRLDADATPTVSDAGGNAFTGTKTGDQTYTVDQSPPPTPSVPNLTTDSGLSSSDDITNDNTPNFSVTGTTGLKLELLNGSTVLSTITSASGSSETMTSSTLTDGTYNISARTTDLAGNTTTSAALPNVKIDTQAPSVSSITPVLSPTRGFIPMTGTITAVDTDPAVQGVGTAFLTELFVGAVIRNASGSSTIGTVASITDDFNLTLTGDASNNISAAGYSIRLYYTVTFNEVMNVSTITTADFARTGSASGSTIFAVGPVTVNSGPPVTAATSSQAFRVSVSASGDGLAEVEKNSDPYSDVAGNSSTNIFNSGTNATIDNTDPTFTSRTPADNAFVNSANVGYILGQVTGGSGSLTSGTVTWTRTGGSADAGSPWVINLTGAELTTGTKAHGALLNGGSVDLKDGTEYTVSYSGVDPAGNTGTANNTIITVDETLPPTNTSTAVTVGAPVVPTYWNSTNTDVEVTVTFAADPTLETGFIQMQGRVSAPSAGTFADVGTPVALAAGDVDGTNTKKPLITKAQLEAIAGFGPGVTIELRARLIDRAGNSFVGSTTTQTFFVDQSPPAVSVPNLTAGTDSGSSNTDNYTNDDTPDFDGTAEANAFVELFEGGTLRGSASATAGGVWGPITSTSIGNSASNLKARATDAAGNTSAFSADLTVTVDQSNPNKPGTPDLASGDDTGLNNNDNVTKTTTGLTFTGTAEADAIIQLRENGGNVGSPVTATSGNYSIDIPLAAGVHTLFTVVATDLAGNTSVPSDELASVTVDTTPPTVGTITFNLNPGGPSANETLTWAFSEDVTPTTSGSGNSFGNFTMTGFTVAAGYDAVLSQTYTHSGRVGTLTANTNNSDWDGSITINYSSGNINDIAGNPLGAIVDGGASDTQAPRLITGLVFNPSLNTISWRVDETLNIAENGDVTGLTTTPVSVFTAKYSGVGTTNTITLTYTSGTAWTDNVTVTYSGSGNAKDNATVPNQMAMTTEPILLQSINIYSDNANFPATLAKPGDKISVEFTVAAGRTLSPDPVVTIGTPAQTAVKDGSVNAPDYKYDYITTTAINNGVVAISITANETTPTAKQTITSVTTNGSSITFDKTAPAAPSTPVLATTDDTAGPSGTNSDAITQKNTALDFSGTAEALSTIILYINGSPSGSTTATAGGAWGPFTADLSTLPLTDPLIDGTYPVTVTATDAAGNVSAPSSALSLVIDNAASPPAGFDLNAADDSGVSNSDNITKNTTGLSISGTSENFARIEIWEGAMQLTTSPATITADGSGIWTADIDLAAGVHDITAKQTDRAGNVSSLNGTPLSITIDTSAPTASATPDLNDSDDTGVSDTDDLTKNTTGLTFSSAPIEANAYVQIFEDGNGLGTIYSFQANGAGVWSGDVSLIEGVHNITTIVTDAAGNPSSSSTARVVTIDDTPPTLDPRSIASSGANPLYAKAGDVVTVSFTADETLANTGGFVPTGNIDGDALSFIAGTPPDFDAYITTDATNTEGIMTFTYTVYDLAGNSTTHTTASDGSSVTFDNTPPTVSSIVVTTPPTTNTWSISNGTSDNTVTYTATFAEPVSGVDASDFIATGLDYAGNASYPLVTGTVSNVSPVSTTVYTVTVNTISNTGQLRLDLKAIATVLDNAGINSNAAFTAGQTYSIVLPEPTNIQGTPTATANNTSSITVNWTNSVSIQTPTHLLITATGPDSQDPPVTPLEFTPTDGNTAISLRALPPEDSDFSDGKGLHIVNLTGALSTSYQFTTLLSGKTYTFKFYPLTLSPNNSTFPDNTNYLLTGIKSASATTQTAAEGSITAGSTSPPSTIGSLSTAFGAKNFTFKLDDDGLNSGSDVSKTLFNTLTIKAGPGNTVTNWEDVIDAAELQDITDVETVTTTNIVGNTIIFATAFADDKEGELDDDEEKEYELRIRLKSSMLNGADSTIDNQIFDFRVDNTSFTFEAASSEFNGSESEISGASFNKVTVLADRLVAISQPPSSALVLVNVSPRAKLRTRDANGNTDLDYSSKVKITNAQSIPMNGLGTGDSLTAVAGVIRFPANFQYADDGNGAANNGTLTVTGKAATLTNTNAVALNNTTVSYSATTSITTGALSLPSVIPSTTTNSASPLAVFDFKVNDDNNGGGDGSPTRITQIVITQGTSGNDIGTWTNVIQDAELVYSSTSSGNGTIPFSVGVVNAGNITFAGLSTADNAEGYIADNDSKTYTLRIYLKTATVTPDLIDNLNLTFRMTNTATNILLGSLSSAMTASDFSSDPAKNAIDVDATELRIVTQPVADILVNKDINLQPGQSLNPAVQVTDAFGNRDLDFGDLSETITVTNAQSLPMSNVPSLPIDGLLTFANGFQYDGIGTGATGNGTLTFTRSGLTGVNSQTVTVRVATSGTITAGATTEASTISSIIDTDPEKVELFDFTISDDPGLAENNIQSDGNPIQISQIKITQNPAVGANTISNWADAIAVAILSDGTNTLTGTVNATDITFGPGATPIPNAAGQLGYITDGTFSVASSKTYNLIIYLKSTLGGTLPETIDGLKFGFEVTAANITTLSNGSLIIGSENENSDPASAGKGEVDVDATIIHFTTIPSSASISVNLNPTVIAKARDINGNRDLDFDNQVITAFSNTPQGGGGAYGTVNGPVINSTDEFDDGVFNFNPNFQFTSGTAITQLTLEAGGISGISPNISVISSFESRITVPQFKDMDGITPYDLADSISYANHQSADLSVTDDSYELVQMVVADGTADGTADGDTPGVPGDLDGASTILTQLKLGATNYTAIRKIAAYNDAGTKIADGVIAQVSGILGEVTFDFTGNEIIADDDEEKLFKIRATFQSSPTLISDTMHIRLSFRDATLGVGSKFYDVPPLSGTYIVGNPPDQVTAPADKNRIEVLATSLDFIKQPGNYAGIDQPIDVNTSDTTGIVHARDKFAVVDLNYNKSVTVSATASPNSYPSSFTNGVLDLSTMQYSIPGNGTLTVVTPNPNSLNSNNTPWATSIPCEQVDVINVTASENTNGVLTTPNLKGGNVNQVIFGFTLSAQHYTANEPTLKGFSITFKDDNGLPYFYKTASSTILKNFKILESTQGTAAGATSIAGIATITQARSARAINLYGASATSFDMVTVVFTPSSNYRNLHDPANPLTYYLQVDVDVSTNIATPAITPFLEDNGYSDPLTRDQVLLTEGSSKITPMVEGPTRSFASTKPPELVSSNPFNGQLNVDTLINTITLFFDVPVTTFDGTAYLYDRYSNTLVATLTATNGNYQWAPGQPISPSPYITNPLTFALPPSFDLKPDSVYYLTINQGRFDPNNPVDRAGISDDGFNLFGGISFSGTLYFKAASKKPPVMKGTDPLKYYFSKTTTTINASFNQRGTGYFMITNTNPTTPPTNAEIKGAAYTGGTIIGRGDFNISQIEPSYQYGTINTGLTPGVTYDVFMFAENDALPNPIGTTAPYGSSGNGFVAGTTGPTIRFTAPAATTSLTNFPRYQICSNSYTQLSDPIIISEVANNQFSGGAGVVQSINLLLPSGFQFDVDVDTVIVQFNGSDFDNTLFNPALPTPLLHYEFINTTILKISFVNNGTSSFDNIIISDLIVIASAPDITGFIERFSGNGIPSIADGHDFAQITSAADDPINFTNSYSNVSNFDQAPINISNTVTYIPDNYHDVILNQSATRLFPLPPTGDYGPTFFNGSGLTDDILNLTAVPLNTGFNITLTHTDMNGCVSIKSDQYTVYNHKNAIAPLGTPSTITGERQVCITNQNFPSISTNQVIVSDSVSADGLAGYKLMELFANIPTKATAGSQIIFGPIWQALVQKIPKVYSAKLDANTGQTYRTYNWNYRPVLNADTAGLLNPYSNFVQPPTPLGKTYYKGGSLGLIEFTGKYHSKADFSVFIPVRQEVEVFLPAIPVVEQVTAPSFTTSSGTLIYCEGIGSAADILINGFPAASPGSSTGVFTLRDSATLALVTFPNGSFIDNGNGTSLLKSSITNNYRTIRVDYTYQDIGSPCSATGSFYIRITPNPRASFAATSVLTSANPIDVGRPSASNAYCENNLIRFGNTSSFPATGYLAHTNPVWDIGVSTAVPQFTDSAFFTYSTNGRYIVSFSVQSQFGCPSQVVSDSIYIGAIPNVSFSLNGISIATPITVVDNSTVVDGPGTDSEIFSAQWKYSPSNVFIDTTKNTFTIPGHYTITLKSTTQIKDTDPGGNTLPLPGCERTFAREVIIVPAMTKEAIGTEAIDSLESADPLKQWQTSSTNSLLSSWERGDATESSSIGLTGNVWATDLDNPYRVGEVSFLYSPAYDLSNLIRPKVSFDHVAYMAQNDGVVLEFSTDTFNIADPLKKWYRIGTNVDGNNWYNTAGLASKPGTQINISTGISSGDFGWGGQINSVLHSQHTLSPDIPPGKRTHVIFRFALASLPTSTADQGFAFDDFRIGERTRVVLIENFTNLGNTLTFNNKNVEKEENDFLRQNFTAIGTDIIKINYHVGFPSLDPFNDDYPTDPGARALYYSVNETPLTRLDGGKSSDIQQKYISGWGIGMYNNRTLQLAQADLEIITPLIKSSTGGYEFNVKITATESILDKENTILHVAFIEESIPISALSSSDQSMVATGESTSEYVLKQMVPSALGTRLMTTLQIGQSETLGPFEWTPDLEKLYDSPDDLALVVFVQNEVTKEIYQAEILRSLQDPDLVTNIEDPDYAKKIQLFPNPANNEVNIQLPAAVSESTPVEMFDTYGKTVYQGSFKAGEQTKTVSTSELTSGVYFIQLSTPDGNIARRKVMVVHR